MDLNKYLILVKGQDKTKEIQHIDNTNGRISITYTNGGTYSYLSSNLKILNIKEDNDARDSCVLKNEQPLSNVTQIQDFGFRIRIIYNNGYSEICNPNEIKIIKSCLSDKKSRDRFKYLRQIAHAISLNTENGFNILDKHYEKIQLVREDSILASYLSGILPVSQEKEIKATIYPFKFNESQKRAVENALNNRISIIQGPPGTGKTQTILNIIANAVMIGETVAVVSSNNSATFNILEKLKEHDVDFITAYLGNTRNKNEFIKNQTLDLSPLNTWALTSEEYEDINKRLNSLSVNLDLMLKLKNELSIISSSLESIRLEYQHYLKYYNETNEEKIDIRVMGRMTSNKLLQIWILSEQYADEERRYTLWYKMKFFFKLGIYNNKFYSYSIDRIVAFSQRRYYEIAQIELEKQKSILERKLSGFSFEEKMEEYSQLSMKLFKSKLADRYHQVRHKRKRYDLEDLWKNSADFIKDYPVILSTTYSLKSSLSKEFIYDYVIIDEASQVDLATGALALSCAKKAVLVGDLLQLPNVVTREVKKKTDDIFDSFDLPEAFRYSDHSFLSSVNQLFMDIKTVMLREHYRCHPKIIEFCNKKFYNDQLIILTTPDTGKKPLMVYKTVAGNHARYNVNQRQIDVLKNEIILNQGLNIYNDSMGIVSPYRNHTNALQKEFNSSGVEADTVDKFQGREKDVIILCTVDNEVSEFTDDPNRLNVAVSRAVNQLIVLTDGNESNKDSNTKDLIDYISYNNFEIHQSEIYSIFDYLYKCYAKQKNEVLKKQKKISLYDSENLMFGLINEVLGMPQFSKYDVVFEVPLKMIIRDPHKLDDHETAYAMNSLTHVDFLIYNKLSKQTVLVVEVDGYSYHYEESKQSRRDVLKNQILTKYNIPYMRFSTTGSNEKNRIITALQAIC